jgi:hypothetical protein
VTAAHEGLRVGLVVTATGLGFRHGIDWDHLAAITDIAGSQDTSRRAMVYGTCYFAGHAAVIGALGVVAIVAGQHLPHSVDTIMERVVGFTLMALGAYVITSLVRNGRNFRMRSRWMLVFSAVRRVSARLRPSPVTHAALATDGHGDHRHRGPVADPFGTYGVVTSLGVGALHGIGAETPTQVLLLAAAASVGGIGSGLVLLGAFLLGLLGSNTVVAVTAAFGFLGASRNFALYAAISVLTGLASLGVGALLLTGQSAVLPALFGG